MIDKKWIGLELPSSQLTLERGRLRLFAQAIGETNPIYIDLEAARAAGYPDLPAPPTFLFSAEMDSGSGGVMMHKLGIELGRVLHGEQSFTYHRAAWAGQTITVHSKIEDIYDKKNGALEFIVKSSRALNDEGELVAQMRGVVVVRN